MDLNDLKVNEQGKRLDLRHPVTGEILTYGENDKKQMHLILTSSDSEIYRRSQRKIVDRRMAQQNFRQLKLTAAQIEDEIIQSLADCTVGGCIYVDGKEIKVVPGMHADISQLYKEYPWIKEQVSNFMEDRSNFL